MREGNKEKKMKFKVEYEVQSFTSTEPDEEDFPPVPPSEPSRHEFTVEADSIEKAEKIAYHELSIKWAASPGDGRKYHFYNVRVFPA